MTGRVVILEVVARNLYWVILAVAVVVLLRGHNEPGGGFIGGLIAVTATVLWAVAHGNAAAERRLPLGSPVRLAAAGLMAAAVSGLPALFSGESFLTHWWGAMAGLKVSTVYLFDAGVFFCVWGALGGYALTLIGPGGDDGERP